MTMTQNDLVCFATFHCVYRDKKAFEVTSVVLGQLTNVVMGVESLLAFVTECQTLNK